MLIVDIVLEALGFQTEGSNLGRVLQGSTSLGFGESGLFRYAVWPKL